MKDALKERILAVAAPILEQQGCYLVELELKRDRNRTLVEFLVETDTGVTIDQCVLLSRALAQAFDLSDLFQTPYRLEVSSPGIDRPLKLLRQYPKNIGRKFHVHHLETGERKEFQGTLTAVDGETLRFTAETGEEKAVAFPDIVESKEVLPW